MSVAPPIGVVLPAKIAPARLPGLARAIESHGFRSVWLPEDAFDRGGIASVVAVLDATTTLRVGLGIASAMVRHPAFMAMELATVAALNPRRFVAGIGLGVPAWLEQMGLTPRSRVRAVRETMVALRRLLDGEEVDWRGERATYEHVRLAFPPTSPVPLHLGVSGPRMLELSGEVADGTVLTEMASIPYVGWARERIAVGATVATAAAGHHELVAYAWYEGGLDGADALERVRPGIGGYLRREPVSALTAGAGLGSEVGALLERHGDGFEAAIPGAWLELFSVAGDPARSVEAILGRLSAGADEVALHPADLTTLETTLAFAAREVLPRL